MTAEIEPRLSAEKRMLVRVLVRPGRLQVGVFGRLGLDAFGFGKVGDHLLPIWLTNSWSSPSSAGCGVLLSPLPPQSAAPSAIFRVPYRHHGPSGSANMASAITPTARASSWGGAGVVDYGTVVNILELEHSVWSFVVVVGRIGRPKER
jgi:hypothetical protein